jgi:TonB family protein
MSLVLIGVVMAIALVWGGIRTFSSNPEATAPPAGTAASAPEPAQDTVPAAPAAEQRPGAQMPPSAPRTHTPLPAARGQSRASNAAPAAKAKSQPAETQVSSAGINEVIPDVPDRARRTIRGHVKVSIRVIVDKDGTVFAALSEKRGPSRYFERLAIDAAKKWTFPPTEATAQRLMLVKFDFTRQGTTAQAGPVK